MRSRLARQGRIRQNCRFVAGYGFADDGSHAGTRDGYKAARPSCGRVTPRGAARPLALHLRALSAPFHHREHVPRTDRRFFDPVQSVPAAGEESDERRALSSVARRRLSVTVFVRFITALYIQMRRIRKCGSVNLTRPPRAVGAVASGGACAAGPGRGRSGSGRIGLSARASWRSVAYEGRDHARVIVVGVGGAGEGAAQPRRESPVTRQRGTLPVRPSQLENPIPIRSGGARARRAPPSVDLPQRAGDGLTAHPRKGSGG